MKLCAFITCFNPDVEKLAKNVAEIQQYAEKVYLLVNSHFAFVLECEKSAVEMVFNGKNIGLSAAFNIGMKNALEAGFSDAILFDQDSFLEKSAFDKFFDEYKESRQKDKVMCIGPSLCIYGKTIATPKWTLNRKSPVFDGLDSVKNVITSGMILNIKDALSIGAFDEKYPVDFCDFVFCWKALYNGFYVLKSRDVYLKHEIGNKNISFGNITIHFHAPYRNYFLVRDTLNIVFRQKETPVSIRFRYAFFLLPRMTLFLVRCDRKTERLKMYWLGFKDYVLKRHAFGSIAGLLQAE